MCRTTAPLWSADTTFIQAYSPLFSPCSGGYKKRGVSFGKSALRDKGLTIKRLKSFNRFFEPPLASKMHSHLVEPARDLTLSDRIQKKGSSVWEVCVLEEGIDD